MSYTIYYHKYLKLKKDVDFSILTEEFGFNHIVKYRNDEKIADYYLYTAADPRVAGKLFIDSVSRGISLHCDGPADFAALIFRMTKRDILDLIEPDPREEANSWVPVVKSGKKMFNFIEED